jgi:hypothetical protein
MLGGVRANPIGRVGMVDRVSGPIHGFLVVILPCASGGKTELWRWRPGEQRSYRVQLPKRKNKTDDDESSTRHRGLQ